MPSESDLLGLIGLVYDTTENPGLWSEFLLRYSGVFRADMAFFRLRRRGVEAFEMVSPCGLNSCDIEGDMEAHSAMPSRGRHYLHGRVILNEHMSPREELVKSEFHNDYVVPTDAVRHVANVSRHDGTDTLMLAAMREQQRPPFNESERHGLQLLLPHVTRAKAVHARLQMLEGSTSVLNALDVALLFTTGSGELVHCTGAAEAIVERGDGLTISNRRLHATAPSADARLRDALRAVTSAVQTADVPIAVTIERPSMKRPYRLLMSPLLDGLMQLPRMRQPDVALIVLDPENPRPAAVNLLKRVYGLTEREAALASTLSTGVSVEEAADTLGMAYETARSHLRRIFAKTDTSRQTELMMLLSRLPKD